MRHELVICTRNRVDDLRRCLDSVAAQSRLPDCVIVVDSSDTDATRRVTEAFANRTGPAVRYVRTAPGLTLQRNVGLDHLAASTDVVHFVDDDTVLESGYLCEILAVFETRPDIGGVGGRDVRLPEPDPVWYRCLFLLNSRRQGVLLRSGVNVQSATGDSERLVDWLSGCSMSYRCRIIGGMRFDESRSGVGPAEDVDFSARVAERARLVWTPLARLEHRLSPVNRDDAAMTLRRTIRSRWRLARDHVGAVNRVAVIYGVSGEFLISMLLAVRCRSRFYGRLAIASATGAGDILKRTPV